MRNEKAGTSLSWRRGPNYRCTSLTTIVDAPLEESEVEVVE